MGHRQAHGGRQEPEGEDQAGQGGLAGVAGVGEKGRVLLSRVFSGGEGGVLEISHLLGGLITIFIRLIADFE